MIEGIIMWAVIAGLTGLILLAAELFIPSHGLLGLLAGIALLVCVVLCFLIKPWLGATVFAVLGLSAPFVLMGFVNFWPHTPIGKRMVLKTNVTGTAPVGGLDAVSAAKIAIGSTGKTLTELRPVGMCEFADTRLESISRSNLIPPNTPVKVVALDGRRPVVEPVQPVALVNS